MLEHIRASKGFEEIEDALKLYEMEGKPGQEEILLNRDFLSEFLAPYSIGEDKLVRIYRALDEIEGNPELLSLFQFLRWDLCRYKNGIDGWFYQNFEFDYESRFPDCR